MQNLFRELISKNWAWSCPGPNNQIAYVIIKPMPTHVRRNFDKILNIFVIKGSLIKKYSVHLSQKGFYITNNKRNIYTNCSYTPIVRHTNNKRKNLQKFLATYSSSVYHCLELETQFFDKITGELLFVTKGWV